MKISVVIPAFNVEKWIAHTIRSVLEQGSAPSEIIVVDDGSSDGTVAAARSVSGRVAIVTQRNRGQGAARNRGAREAAGDWVMFLDADDLLFPNAFQALSRASTQWSSAWAINPRYEVMKPDGATARGPTHRREVYDRSHLAQVLMKNPFAGNMLMRRAVWEEHPYSEDQELRYCEDLELWIRLLLAGGRIVIPPEILIQRREARPGASTGQLRSMRRDRHRLFTRMRHEPRLNPLERAVVRYQIVRTSIGRRVLDSRFGAREPSR